MSGRLMASSAAWEVPGPGSVSARPFWDANTKERCGDPAISRC